MAHVTIHRSKGNVTRIQPTKDKSKHFLDNEKFKQAIKDYQDQVRVAEAEGKPHPVMSNYIGTCIIQICEALSKKHYFIGYSWIDEMISVAQIQCIKSIPKFDVDKGTSAFSYFTQVAWFEFINYIKEEKDEKIAKAAIVQNMGSGFSDMDFQDVDKDEDFHNSMTEILQLQSMDISFLNKKPRARKEPVYTHVSLDAFFEDMAGEIVDEMSVVE